MFIKTLAGGAADFRTVKVRCLVMLATALAASWSASALADDPLEVAPSLGDRAISGANQLAALDLAVIAVYALGMLSVGWYYARRTKTREEYLLGGRAMRPLAVGVSLFASLMSTISYLAWPGEVIKNGPMYISSLLAYPLIGVVVGWLMVPFIMRMKVTSAYEILELRLGPEVRTVGSLLFLLLRLLWMSVIVYAATTKVLVPLLGLDPRTTPIVCGLLAVVTVVYTTMGGLRAVVITDLIQSAILFGAAIATVVTITVSLGSVGAWWPSQWQAHWPEPCYGYDPEARVTLFNAVLATFTWYVCTSASDQIAIQRYLATRDAKAARTVLFTSLAADGLVSLLLAAVGFSLLAYFQAHPGLLSDAQAALNDSDKLFPLFITIGLPTGLSGLVVAGLLACAMSALSAGVNSTSSVIAVDFVDRFGNRRENASEADRVKLVKWISVLVGVAVVSLSLLVNMVHGNLLDLCFKVVNLFTAPLAGLFFLAMFVPWAKAFGALIGAACGVITVVAVTYWKELTGTQGISFLWAMPLSLAVEVGVGALVSLIPVGRKRTPIEWESGAGRS
jgi:SSS family solute:Na+ symporter